MKVDIKTLFLLQGRLAVIWRLFGAVFRWPVLLIWEYFHC